MRSGVAAPQKLRFCNAREIKSTEETKNFQRRMQMLEYMSRERCFRAGCLALAGCIAIFLLRRPAWSLPATERHPHSLDDTNVFFRVYHFFLTILENPNHLNVRNQNVFVTTKTVFRARFSE